MAHNSMRSLRIKRFHLADIKLGSTVQIIGPRGNGKTKLMMELCYENRNKFDEVYAWSYTDFMNLELEDFLPRQHIFRRFKERDMASLVRKQQQDWRAYNLNLKRGRPAVPGKEICFLLDDCAFKGDLWSTDIIQEIFYNGRHSHVTFVFVTQDAGDLNKNMRGQVDVVFATRELTKVNIKTLHENYFGVFDLPRDFRRTFKQLTQNFQMLVLVKNLSRSTKLSDLVFWYKARIDLPPFRMGSDQAWAISDQQMDMEDPEDKARRDEELVKQKVAEAIAAKQPLHEVVQCDSRGRPVSQEGVRKKKRKLRRKRHGLLTGTAMHGVPAGLSRFDRVLGGLSTKSVAPRSAQVNPFPGNI